MQSEMDRKYTVIKADSQYCAQMKNEICHSKYEQC